MDIGENCVCAALTLARQSAATYPLHNINADEREED